MAQNDAVNVRGQLRELPWGRRQSRRGLLGGRREIPRRSRVRHFRVRRPTPAIVCESLPAITHFTQPLCEAARAANLPQATFAR